MNKTSLSDVLNQNTRIIRSNYVDIGANGFEIRAVICGVVNDLTHTADIHITCGIIAVPSSRPDDVYEVFDLAKIASVLGCKMVDYDGLSSRVSIEFANYEKSDGLDTVLGRVGLIFDPIWRDRNYAGISRIYNANGEQGVISSSWKCYNTGNIYQIDIYHATLVY